MGTGACGSANTNEDEAENGKEKKITGLVCKDAAGESTQARI